MFEKHHITVTLSSLPIIPRPFLLLILSYIFSLFIAASLKKHEKDYSISAIEN